MKKLKSVCVAIAMASAAPTFAGGLLTNTNQHVAFNRMMSREASIGIDGVYYNPAGVVFMGEGHHLAINWQLAYQTRTINNDYKLFTNNVNNPITPRDFKGKAFAPVIPSFQYAYNKGKWSFQANFSLTGGGGKCTFDDGLGSFEKSYQRLLLLLADWQVSLIRLWVIHLSNRECYLQDRTWKCSLQTRLSAKQASTASTAICTVASITMVSL